MKRDEVRVASPWRRDDGRGGAGRRRRRGGSGCGEGREDVRFSFVSKANREGVILPLTHKEYFLQSKRGAPAQPVRQLDFSFVVSVPTWLAHEITHDAHVNASRWASNPSADYGPCDVKGPLVIVQTRPRCLVSRPSMPSWIPPPDDYVKINVDVVVLKSENYQGVVAAISPNAEATYMGPSVLTFSGISDPATLEALACH